MKKFLLSIFCCLMALVSVQAEEYSYTFTSKQFLANGTKALNSVNWTLAGNGNYWGYDGTKGQQFGSGNAPYKSLTLSTSGIEGTITKIVINTSGGSKVNATLTVSVGGATFGTKKTLTANATNYTFEGSASGEIKFSYTQTSSKAIYIKSIVVTYTTEEGGGENPEPDQPETPEAPAAPTLPATQSFDNSMTVTITSDATVYYTTDGTIPSETNGTEYTAPFTITETKTVKAIAVNEGGSSEVVSATYTKNEPVDPNTKTATLSFASTAQRLSQDGNSQVWSNEGITFTNNKAASTNAVVSNFNPVRLYKSSEIIVECALGNIVAIEFDCDNSNSNQYLTPLCDVITGYSLNGDKVTVALNGTSNKYELSLTAGQVRLDAITVTYLPGATKPVVPTLTAGGNFVGSKSVAITCATEGAKIYYTTNGDEPTAVNGTEYSAPFEITETTTVKAIAVNEVGESGVATATYTRVAATPEISFSGEATFEESIEVTVNAAEGTTAYYTLSGSNPTNKSTKYTEPLTIKAGATLKVIAYDEDGYKSEVVEQKFVMATGESAGAAAGTATLVESVAELAIGDQIVIVAAAYDYALSTTQNGNNRGRVAITKDGNNVTLVDNVQILTLEEGTVDGTFAFNTGSGYLYAASSDNNYLRTQTTNNANGSWSIEIASGKATIEAQGTNTRNLLKYNNNNSIFSAYGSGQQVVSIYKVNIATIEDYILNVTDAGWATLFLGHNVVIPDDVTCYVIPEVTESTVELVEITTGVIPASTAVIVKADEGEYTFEVAGKADAVETKMAGTTINTYIKDAAYVLGADENGVVGLYKADMAGGVWLNNANKAYLPASAVPAALQGAASFSFRYEGTTSIEEVETENAVKAIYDLTGRRVETITAPGIYIVNGKKVLVK